MCHNVLTVIFFLSDHQALQNLDLPPVDDSMLSGKHIYQISQQNTIIVGVIMSDYSYIHIHSQ